MIVVRRLLAFAFIAVLFLAAYPGRAAQPRGWLLVSDIHFDPFADAHIVEKLAATPGERWRAIFAADDQPMSGYGADTNYTLLESALDAMRNAEGDPPAIVLTGDFLAHHFRKRFDEALPGRDDAAYASFVDNTIAFLASEFRAAYPHAQFIAAVGNNDSYCGDYQTTPNSPFFEHFAAAWGLTHSDNGYYTTSTPASGVTAIVLDDVFMSAEYANACGSDKSADIGAQEIAWLGKTLDALAGRKVWIIMHIPPGIDTFSWLHSPAGALPPLFLAQRYNDALNATLGNTRANIVAAFGAHTHMNGFRLLGSDPSRPRIGMLINPAVSPIFASNPTFAVMRVDEASGLVQDVRYYVIDDLAAHAKDAHLRSVWRREYDFDGTYGAGAIDAEHLIDLQHRIFDDEKVRKRYESYHDGGSGRAPMTEANWRAYWCSNVALTATAFLACASPDVQPVKRSAVPDPQSTHSTSPRTASN